MDEINNLKSKITHENKTIFGIVGIILAVFGLALAFPTVGIITVTILILPAFFLIIPGETIKNSKVLAIVSGIILGLLLIVGIGVFYVILTDYLPSSYLFPQGYVARMVIANIVQFVLCFYGLFCAVLLTIQTKPKQQSSQVSNDNSNKEKKHDKYCANCGTGLNQDAKFCSNCGTQVKD